MADWIVATISQYGYPGIFLLMLLEAVFPPLPSELIAPFAGYAAARGDLDPIGVLVSASLGSVAGMVPWYLAGRLIGLERVRHLADRFGRWLAISPQDIDRAANWFGRFGALVVFFGRLLPIIRTVISVPAGLARMPPLSFAGASLAGILIWNAALIGAGHFLHEQYHLVGRFLEPLTIAVLAGMTLAYVWRILSWRRS
jgi:membrane protein DedA with SNARE-associated domain